MSLKIPGVGNILTEFEYSAASNSSGNVIVSISYYDAPNTKKDRLFELRCDERFKTQKVIVETVLECLTEAKDRHSVKIREEKDRSYVYFGHYQFTGNMLSQK